LVAVAVGRIGSTTKVATVTSAAQVVAVAFTQALAVQAPQVKVLLAETATVAVAVAVARDKLAQTALAVTTLEVRVAMASQPTHHGVSQPALVRTFLVPTGLLVVVAVVKAAVAVRAVAQPQVSTTAETLSSLLQRLQILARVEPEQLEVIAYKALLVLMVLLLSVIAVQL
jgi:hypothetical protein